MFDSKETFDVLIRKLRLDLNKSKYCEGSDNFSETVRELSRDFYDYFNCASRLSNIRSLVNIQAEIELSEKNMKDFENLSKNLFNVIFTLRALGMEIEKMRKSLELLYKQVEEFWTAVKLIQTQNIKIMKIFTDIWKVLTNLKKDLYVLNRYQREFIENNLGMGFVSFAEYISCSPNEELNNILESLGNSSVFFSETIRQVKYLNYLLFHHQKLKDIHCLFSFQVILLINNPFIKNPEKKDIPNKKFAYICAKLCCKSKATSDLYITNIPESVLRSLEIQTLQIGETIFSKTREVREIHCASIRREEIVLSDLQAKRIVLLKGLNELQNIITVLSEIESSNDILVGKMVKMRPLFQRIKEYLKFDVQEMRDLMNNENSSVFEDS